MSNRDSKGRWVKGSSPNPNGRPKRATTLEGVIERGSSWTAIAEYMAICAASGDRFAMTCLVAFLDKKKEDNAGE